MASAQGITRQVLPSATADGTQQQVRLNKYGELMVANIGGQGMSALAGEGSYFRACNATFGTAIACATTTAFSTTAATLSISNSASAAGVSLYMDYIRLITHPTQTATALTAWHGAIAIDTAQRYASGGTALTAVNANSGLSTSSSAVIYFGAVVAAAIVAPRYLSRFVIKTASAPAYTNGDQMYINFQSYSGSIGPLSGTVANQFCIDAGPAVLGPGNNHTLLLHLWWPSIATAGLNLEVELGWWER